MWNGELSNRNQSQQSVKANTKSSKIAKCTCWKYYDNKNDFDVDDDSAYDDNDDDDDSDFDDDDVDDDSAYDDNDDDDDSDFDDDEDDGDDNNGDDDDSDFDEEDDDNENGYKNEHGDVDDGDDNDGDDDDDDDDNDGDSYDDDDDNYGDNDFEQNYKENLDEDDDVDYLPSITGRKYHTNGRATKQQPPITANGSMKPPAWNGGRSVCTIIMSFGLDEKKWKCDWTIHDGTE